MSYDLDFLLKSVKKASLLINDDFQVKAKDDHGDLVTDFDLEVEKSIINDIKNDSNYAGFDIISEEFNSDNKLTDNCFTIDPIDGTINFVNNIPLWAIQVACIKNGKTVASVIYLVKFGEIYYADESGAYMNGERIHVNDVNGKNAIFVIEGLVKYSEFNHKTKLQSISRNTRNYNSTAVDFAWIASGKMSAVNFVWNTVWDYVPGQFLVKQAGGVIYNDNDNHIGANNIETLEDIKLID